MEKENRKRIYSIIKNQFKNDETAFWNLYNKHGFWKDPKFVCDAVDEELLLQDLLMEKKILELLKSNKKEDDIFLRVLEKTLFYEELKSIKKNSFEEEKNIKLKKENEWLTEEERKEKKEEEEKRKKLEKFLEEQQKKQQQEDDIKYGQERMKKEKKGKYEEKERYF